MNVPVNVVVRREERPARGCRRGVAASGHAADDLISRGFKTSPTHAALLNATPPVTALDPAHDDAEFVCGGPSPMVTMIDEASLHAFVARA